MRPSKRHDAPHDADKSHQAEKPAVPPEKKDDESAEENDDAVREDSDDES